MTRLHDGPQLVDWDTAVATATRLARPGPSVTPAEARAAVAELRRSAAEAEGHVRGFTRLTASSGSAPVVVVDRPGWVQANTEAFEQVLGPLGELIAQRRGPGKSGTSAVSSRLAGVQVGALLAYLSGRVLGQFDPFHDAEGRLGRLLLVAPNVVSIERELEVDPTDFRMWVCLHEETHRVQFTAVEWLREFLRSQIRAFVSETEVDADALASRLREAVGAVVGSLRGQSDVSLVEVVQTPRQREILDRLTGLMSLLEGHAEYVMDGVGPEVVPSVAEIRSKFTRRRSGTGPVDQAIRRVLGLEMKMRQYRDGAAFVRAVVDAVGVEDFNRVWTSPETLPTKAEITDAPAWIERVVSRPAVAS
jgi:coenzyme F420 biosynthesis associated uncharacterized protein